jgi:adenine-specific DNA-methyltransferase
MHKRLEIAKRLLSDKGVIFISIDDNEQAQLKMLCDEVFLENNFISELIWKKKQGGGNDSTNFVVEHEYVTCYSKSISNIKLNLDSSHVLDDSLYPFKNENGIEYGLITLDKSSIRFSESLVFEIKDSDGNIYYPRIVKGKQSCWRWGKKKVEEEYNDLVFKNGKVYTKYYRPLGVVPKSILYDTRFGRTESGKDAIKEVLGNAVLFSYPKPLELINHILKISTQTNSTILDFFAGSGTTLQATMQLNAEDGGSRQCILVTNNENNICEEVTYERNRRVIQGYTNTKGERVNGLRNNNLRYYKSDYVPSQKTEQNKRLLTRASTELLQIKEDCYTDITSENGFDSLLCKLFTNERGKYLIVLFHSRKQLSVIELLVEWIKSRTDATEKIRLYGFSPEKETLVADFWEVADKIEAVPLPEAIYNAYRATFKTIKLNKKPATASTDDNLETDEE